MKKTPRWPRGLLHLTTLISVVLVLSGCLLSTKEIPFESIVESEVSDHNLGEPQLVLISSREELETLPRLYPDTPDKVGDLDKVMDETDFSDQYLLVAFQGRRPWGGFGIEILDIQQSGKRIVTRAEFTSSEGGGTLGVESPYHLVRVKKADLGTGTFTFVLVDDSTGKKVARETYTLE